jgi:hypothetical protein
MKAILQERFDALSRRTAIRNDGEYYRSPEFREKVVEELIKRGATWEQAENLTRDSLRLHQQAQRLWSK